MKVLVTGGRKFSNGALVRSVLDCIHLDTPITLLIHGGATGADELAGAWATLSGVPVEVHRADWIQHGRAAGPIRNCKMLQSKPDLVVAFPGGAGTADMVKQAKAAGVTVWTEWSMKIGPQRGPASVRQIDAQVKSAQRMLW